MSQSRRQASTSSKTMVSGSSRYKYFKRPIMPRVSAVPTQVLLAPTNTENNPMVPVDNRIEPTVKDAEVQTAYRESEAQTVPYTPDFVVGQGEDPDILLLKNFTYDNGLPLGKKEIEMIEYARAKREMESNLPPFTDEASLILRKRLMEHQEMREFKLREAEIDSKRDAKLESLERALVEREESNEFMTSQRLESIRLLRLEEREKVMQKIRNKRIKALRRLAHQRNASEPVLSEGTKRDIINDYFDKGSKVYAPAKREGKDPGLGPEHFDIASRTMPLDNLGNILSLESTIPRRLTDDGPTSNMMMNKTAPVKAKSIFGQGGGRVAEERLTSAAQRAQRLTKRDVEEMHQILLRKKLDALGVPQSANEPGSPDVLEGMFDSGPRGANEVNRGNDTTGKGKSSILSSLLAKKPKGRPPTPDFTKDRAIVPPPDVTDEEVEPAGDAAPAQATTTVGATARAAAAEPVEEIDYELRNNHPFQAAVVLLQRLIRGRAVQNIMFEGKYRRRELINELKQADEEAALYQQPDDSAMRIEAYGVRAERLRETTIDAAAGSSASNIFAEVTTETDRWETIAAMQTLAKNAAQVRKFREAAESGRRERQGLVYPDPDAPDEVVIPYLVEKSAAGVASVPGGEEASVVAPGALTIEEPIINTQTAGNAEKVEPTINAEINTAEPAAMVTDDSLPQCIADNSVSTEEGNSSLVVSNDSAEVQNMQSEATSNVDQVSANDTPVT